MLSVVILNWNGKSYLKECLNSIYKQSYKDFEVILVDNGSTDGSVEFVKKNFPKVKIIENKKNIGFAKGNNVGIKHAVGDYVFILNNDTKLDRNCLAYLNEVIEKHAPGMIAPKIVYLDNLRIDSLGLEVLCSGLGKDIKYPKRIFCPCGCAAVYKKEMLEDIKILGDYFDSDFFIYSEDLDLGFRARLMGWKCMPANKAIVYHAHGGTMKSYSNFSIYLGDRNRIWTLVKNFPQPLIIKYLPFILLLQVATIMKYAIKGKLVIILKAKFDAIKGLAKMLKKRKIIQKKKKIMWKEIDKLITKKVF